MKMNKKAMMDDWMDVAFTFIISLIIFFTLFSFITGFEKVEEKRIHETKDLISHDALLLLYAKSNVSEKITADLISESYQKKDYKTLEKHTQSFFSKYDITSWQLRLSVSDSEVFSTNDEAYPQSGTRVIRIKLADLIIPTEDPSKNIQIELLKGIRI